MEHVKTSIKRLKKIIKIMEGNGVSENCPDWFSPKCALCGNANLYELEQVQLSYYYRRIKNDLITNNHYDFGYVQNLKGLICIGWASAHHKGMSTESAYSYPVEGEQEFWEETNFWNNLSRLKFAKHCLKELVHFDKTGTFLDIYNILEVVE